MSDLHTWQYWIQPVQSLEVISPHLAEARKKKGGKLFSDYIEGHFMRWLGPGRDQTRESVRLLTSGLDVGPRGAGEKPNAIGELLIYLLRHLSRKNHDRAGMGNYYHQALRSDYIVSISENF
ncbi:hypothetical protein [Saccharopolyspora shandongensis]|uniref:hypothetical protein n=1 Tax=Saccharopolyspora shandongensis TaxID=418495 RepID=UPI00340A085A